MNIITINTYIHERMIIIIICEITVDCYKMLLMENSLSRDIGNSFLLFHPLESFVGKTNLLLPLLP